MLRTALSFIHRALIVLPTLFHVAFKFFACCQNSISERFPMGWPSITGIGKPVLPRMWREPHAAPVHLDQDRSVLGPELFCQSDYQRTDTHRSRPLFFVCLIKCGVQ